MNQCDGCQRGLPSTKVMQYGGGYQVWHVKGIQQIMRCTKDRYEEQGEKKCCDECFLVSHDEMRGHMAITVPDSCKDKDCLCHSSPSQNLREEWKTAFHFQSGDRFTFSRPEENNYGSYKIDEIADWWIAKVEGAKKEVISAELKSLSEEIEKLLEYCPNDYEPEIKEFIKKQYGNDEFPEYLKERSHGAKIAIKSVLSLLSTRMK